MELGTRFGGARPDAGSLDASSVRAALRRRLFGIADEPDAIGRYAIESRVGSGGMGTVYAAHDLELDRRVALKLLHPSNEDQSSLRREAQAMAQLRHPNVVSVFDVGEYRGRLYLVMELVDGTPLSTWLRTHRRAWRAAVDLFIQAGRGLAAAHDAGIVHRDFKPANVLVGRDGRVRVTDFGVCGVFTTTGTTPTAGSGTVAGGTPNYASPEQRAGRPVDARSDQYSFCLALGQAAPSLGTVWTRGLADDPERRYASMSELLAALEHSQRRRWTRLALMAGVATATVAAGAWALRPAADDRCAGARELFPPPQRAAVRAAFEKAAAPVEDALSHYAQTWAAHYEQACSDPGPLLDLQMACLRSRRQEFEAFVQALTEADAALVARAPDAAGSLSGLDACFDADRLAAGIPLPDDPQARAAIAAADESLARARALSRAGRYPDALASAQSAATAAHGIEYLPLRARALDELGYLQEIAGDLDAAEASLREAVDLAGQIGDDRLAARSWVALVWTVANTGRLTEALELARFAEAGIERAGEPGRLQRPHLHNVIGTIHLKLREFDEAVRRFEAARETWGTDDADAIHYANATNNLGIALRYLGRPHQALAVGQEAMLILQRELGPEHPDVTRLVHNLDKAARAAGLPAAPR